MDRRPSTVPAERFRANCWAAHPSSIATHTVSASFSTPVPQRSTSGTLPTGPTSGVRIMSEIFALTANHRQCLP
ncbi:hypothetical protein ACFFX0_31220 [Citricoccus parietis]|uniref:Uncharacterized protein n=1 Tax=Citricoccus parietis TaxID=592307 RepID=A0ABV5G8Y6_9MICC